ncbi:hypothetical protein HMPREF3208_00636 [Gardnerella vaginalis]|uniref:Uncharacterized protein n=1 Tax=Gardnerella vaginalis TaxID=2702 RepID=A0A133NXX0_GARVA|nr:hypothetical protein HMPREF3208_00636 [Gardnerella vaginalis]
MDVNILSSATLIYAVLRHTDTMAFFIKYRCLFLIFAQGRGYVEYMSRPLVGL